MIKVLVILGPTATGKSDLAVQLALKHNGEIISADSRQVYRGLDIGTGKITAAEMSGITHHLLDIKDPQDRFSVNEWKKLSEENIADIHARGKLPIIVGGTGFYISALVDNIDFPEVESDPEEQKKLESRSAEELFLLLSTLDPRRAADMSNDGESTNKRRLSRAIIVARALGQVKEQTPSSKYDTVMIGLTLPDEELKARIRNRLIKRIDAGMIQEAEKLHADGLSYKRMDELGLEYRYLAQYLQGTLNKEQLVETLNTKIWQYARRQKTWFKRDERIKWFTPSDMSEIEAFIAH